MTEPLAEIRNYDDLHNALRERADAINIPRTAIDELTGLADGYAGKVLGQGKTKKLGPLSFGAMLAVLGLKLLLVEDSEQTHRMRDRWEARVRRCPNGDRKEAA